MTMKKNKKNKEEEEEEEEKERDNDVTLTRSVPYFPLHPTNRRRFSAAGRRMAVRRGWRRDGAREAIPQDR